MARSTKSTAGRLSRRGVHDLTGNAAVLKEVNTVRILNRLRRGGPASRAELARATGLDAKTITNLVARLIRDGLITADRSPARRRGRPPEALILNADAAAAIGIDFGASQVSAVLVDLAGGLRERFHEEYATPRTRAFLLRKALATAREMIASLARGRRRRLAGVGLSVPGLLDRRRGVVRNSVNIAGFRDVPIVRLFESELGLPVILEEASRAMAIGEIWFGPPGQSGDFICVDLGYGIGMGVVHDGLLYRGANEMSGEIGHTAVRPRGARCSCGKRGCLETVASGRALGKLARVLPGHTGTATNGAKALCEAARAGDRRALRAIREAGEAIGIAVANLINLFDPARVVLNGGLVKAGYILVKPIRKTVREHVVGRPGRQCTVEVSTVGELAGAMGAAMLPLRSFFEFDNIRI